MESTRSIYGHVNGKPVYTRDEFIFEGRHFGPIESDDELLAYAEKVTWGWAQHGTKRSFLTYYLGDYALDHPACDLTKKEYERLKELQREAIKAAREADEAREWKLIRRDCYADNSVEEIWEDKNGERKTVMVEYPHGDLCY